MLTPSKDMPSCAFTLSLNLCAGHRADYYSAEQLLTELHEVWEDLSLLSPPPIRELARLDWEEL